MAQKLFDDKIGLISHSGGIISLAASRLTIGGQQYITSQISRTISSDLTMTATNQYMVYAVRNSGNTELRISSNVNSIGPAGFSSWKLVGAFLTNSSSAWGAFVTIEGVPTSETFLLGTISITATTTPPTKGTTLQDAHYVQRVGDRLIGTFKYRQNAAGSAGSGSYVIQTGFTIDTGKVLTGNVGGAEAPVGDSFFTGGGANPIYNGNSTVLASPLGIIMSGQQNGDVVNTYDQFGTSAASTTFANTNQEWGGDYNVPISTWSRIPLKDL